MSEQPTSVSNCGTKCHCPFCDASAQASSPFCTACGLELRWCQACGQANAASATTCAACGQPLR